MRGTANLASRVCVPEIIHRQPPEVNQKRTILGKVNPGGLPGIGPFRAWNQAGSVVET